MRLARYIPAYTMPVRGWGVHVYVRCSRIAGQYEVDPGWQTTAEGGLVRSGEPRRVHGRRAAVRAAQHRARPRPPHTGKGRIPPDVSDRPPRRPRHTLYGPTLRAPGGHNSAIRYANGTWVVMVPAMIVNDDVVSAWDYVYRSRRDALRGYQNAARHVPRGWAGSAFRADPDPLGF